MKIGFVYDAIFPAVHGGAERRFYEVGRRLAAENEVHLISWSYYPSGPLDDIQLRGLGKPPRLHDKDGRRRLAEAVLFGVRLAQFLRREKYDLIDCCSIPYTSLQIVSRLAGSAAMVATWHEYMGDEWRRYKPALAPLLSRFEASCAELGNRRVAVSEFTRRRLPDQQATVIPNGVNTEAIARSPQGVKDTSVLYVGRLMPHKRVDLALEALSQMSAGTTMTVVGTGPDEARLKRLAHVLGLTERIRFQKALNEQALFGPMKAADVLVQPSDREGQSIVVSEAMACGLPVVAVAGSMTAATENVRDGETGYVVKPSSGAVADALRRILVNPELRAYLSQNAASSSAVYDWSLVAERTCTLYQELV